MLRNMIIILVSLGIVFWCLYVLRKRNDFGSLTKKVTIGLGLLWLITTFLPNIPVMLAPLTPPIKGIVIDEDTKQPISNCNIKAYWNVETYSLAGAHTEAYHSFHTNTDARGYFEIPRHQKVLGLYGFVPLILLNRYAGIHIVAYDYSYKYKLIGIGRDNVVWTSLAANDNEIQPVIKIITLIMEHLKEPVSYIENITNLELNILSHKNYQKKLTASDITFLTNGASFLIKHHDKLDCSIYKNGILPRYSKLIEELGAIDRSIKVREMGMSICSKEATYENIEIGRLKQLQRINQTKGGR